MSLGLRVRFKIYSRGCNQQVEKSILNDFKYFDQCFGYFYKIRWQHISRRLRELGIIVLSIASDSDPKFNSAMRKSCMLGAESKMIAANWFKCGVEILPMQGKPLFIQDTPHIGTKLRNALLKTFTNRDLYPFGDKYFIRLDHVKFPKG